MERANQETSRSFFFQPSGSSKSSTGRRTPRGRAKKLKEGVKYNIDAIKTNGEPLAPKNIANKSVRQYGVLVKDQLPISLQEWKEPAKKCPDLTFVDDRAKSLLWEKLMEHFTLPDHFTYADVQKVKDVLLGRWQLHSTTTRKLYGPTTSKEERRLQNSREHLRSKENTGPLS